MNFILPCAKTNHQQACFLAKLAVRALYFEIKIYPKPGLVSFVDSGAHQDMDGTTFYRSLVRLRHYFYDIARLAQANQNFAQLKARAIQAEQQMLAVTKQINTHRGAIFLLGLFCTTIARLWQQSSRITYALLQQQFIADWQKSLLLHQLPLQSHGAKVRDHYKIVDALTHASQGYPIIFEVLATFTALYHQTLSLNISGLYAYLKFLIAIDDTTVLYRQGQQGLVFAKNRARLLLDIACFDKRERKAIQVHQLFSQQGISPGGVADLIVGLIFIAQLGSASLQCHY